MSDIGIRYIFLQFYVFVNLFIITQGAAPTFPTQSISVDVLESYVVGGLVIELGATDLDGDTLSYSLDSVNPPGDGHVFSVAPSGEITTRTKLDYETRTAYTLVVRAAANGEVAEQTVYINIINVNEAPEFPSDIIGATAENYATEGYTVTRIQAVDPDNTVDTVYTITAGNLEGHFLIGQLTGEITVAAATRLNKTEIAAYALTVEAADNGTPPMTGTTTVVIGVCGCEGLLKINALFYSSILIAVLWQRLCYT